MKLERKDENTITIVCSNGYRHDVPIETYRLCVNIYLYETDPKYAELIDAIVKNNAEQINKCD